MARSYTVRGRIIADDEATPAVERAQGAFARLTNFLSDHFVITLGDVQRAIRGVIDIFKGFIESAAEEELAVKKLVTALSGLGPAAASATDELLAQAAALQETTTASDEAIIAGQALVASFTDNVDQIKAATQAALDLAAATGVDLQSAFLLLGKAAAGETATLSRYGIVIEENIPKSEKFAAAIAGINEQFGGQAAARVETFTGGVEQLGNRLDELSEIIGRSITENSALAGAFATLSTTLTNLQPAIQKVADLVIGPLVTAFVRAGEAIQVLVGTLGGPFAVVLNGVATVVTALVNVFLGLVRAVVELDLAITKAEIGILRFTGASEAWLRSALQTQNALLEQKVALIALQESMLEFNVGVLELTGNLEKGSLASAGLAKNLDQIKDSAAGSATAVSALGSAQVSTVPSVGQLNDGVERQTASLADLEGQLGRTTAAMLQFRAVQGQQVQQLSTQQALDQGFFLTQGGTRINAPTGGSRLVRPGRTFEIRGGSFVP